MVAEEHTKAGGMKSPYSEYRVLIADDLESVTTLIHRELSSRLNCTILIAHDGDQVIEILEKEDPVDVLVTDMMMPGLHGLELVSKVKAGYPGMNIVVMTGYASDFPYVEVIHAGADDFLSKPFPHAELEAKLIRLFKERALFQSRMLAESKYRGLFELSGDGMMLIDGEDYHVVDANRAFRRLCGLDVDDYSGKPVFDIFESRDRVRLDQWLKVCSQRGGGTMADLAIMHPEGRSVHVDVSVSFIETRMERILFLTFKDVTEKREVEQQLADAAQKDQLTGLFNKRSFQNRIEWVVKQTQQAGGKIALMMIDLDNFKRCNDTHGHQIGDKLLMSIGDVLRRSLRSSNMDEGFRCGGDEFTVLLQGTDMEGAYKVAERIQNHFAKLETYGTTMSIGLSEYVGGMAVDDFIRAADKALYAAKAMGKNAIQMA
jgi:two-component system, cell cycle response regulator